MRHNSWKGYFKLTTTLFIIAVLCRTGLQASIFWLHKTDKDKDIVISEQNKALEKYKSLTGFTKLMAVKELEGKYTETSRSSHIQKVITMLDEIKTLDQSGDETLILSDFKVDLEKITLKGRVSNLLLLYYSNPERGIISLIDRFKNLDFIENMKIKNYTKDKDGNFFSFILEANVIKDGK